jgi:hypothetical protein
MVVKKTTAERISIQLVSRFIDHDLRRSCQDDGWWQLCDIWDL